MSIEYIVLILNIYKNKESVMEENFNHSPMYDDELMTWKEQLRIFKWYCICASVIILIFLFIIVPWCVGSFVLLKKILF